MKIVDERWMRVALLELLPDEHYLPVKRTVHGSKVCFLSLKKQLKKKQRPLGTGHGFRTKRTAATARDIANN